MIFRTTAIAAAAFIALAATAAQEPFTATAAATGRIYAGQNFEIVFDIALPQLSDLNLSRPTGLPDALDLGTPVAIGASQADPSNPAAGIIAHVSMPAMSPIPLSVSPGRSTMQVDVTEQVRMLFGVSRRTMRRTVPVSWHPFEVLPLPEEGRPADFSGAVGEFSIESAATTDSPAVGDIVDWRLRLTGRGRLNGATFAAPDPDAAIFRAYQGDASDPEPGTVAAITRRIVPLSPGDFALPTAKFAFFNPSTGQYCVAEAQGPVLHVAERRATSEAGVKSVDLASPNRDPETTVSEELLQLRLAPSGKAMATHLVVPGALETMEAPPGLGWRRVRDKTSGHSGWIPDEKLSAPRPQGIGPKVF